MALNTKMSLNFSRLLKTPGRMPYRQINTPSDDINQIVLLGRVNYLHLNENSNNVYVSIGLTTKNSYMTSNGYSLTYAYHNVYVFGQPLVDKVKHLTKGDRLCVTGLLSSYLADDGQWKFCITANTVSPYVAESIDNVVNDEESTEQDEVDGEEMFGNYIHDKVDTDNKDSSMEPTVNKT